MEQTVEEEVQIQRRQEGHEEHKDHPVHGVQGVEGGQGVRGEEEVRQEVLKDHRPQKQRQMERWLSWKVHTPLPWKSVTMIRLPKPAGALLNHHKKTKVRLVHLVSQRQVPNLRSLQNEKVRGVKQQQQHQQNVHHRKSNQVKATVSATATKM